MNNMLKTTIIAGFAAVLGSATLAAQDAAPAQQAPAAKCDSSASCFAPSLSKFGASVSFGYEDAYVFRGKYQTDHNFQGSVDFGYALTDAWGVYAGVWNSTPLSGDNSWVETDISIGTTFAVAGFVFDFGYTYYWYNYGHPYAGFGDTNELKFGVAYDMSALLGDSLGGVSITPSLYYYYDFDRNSNDVEAAINVVLPVAKWMFNKDFLNVETSAYAGFSNQERFADGRGENNYWYIGLSADLVWKVNEICAIKGGIRWAANDDGDKYGDLQNYHSDNNVWYGLSCVIGF